MTDRYQVDKPSIWAYEYSLWR